MSAVGQWRTELQARPEYQYGWDAAERGDGCDPGARVGDARQAYEIGYDDCITYHTERDEP